MKKAVSKLAFGITKRIVIAVVILVVLALAAVYILSNSIVDKIYHIPLTAIHISNDSASIREGARLTHIEHCSDCHGVNLSGDFIKNTVAPDITKIIPTYSNKQLKRLLRDGVKKDGHSVYIMPSYMYH